MLSRCWLRYTGPAVTLSFDVMLDILLMVVIGGMGTLYGAVIGADDLRARPRPICRAVMAMISHAHGRPCRCCRCIFDPDRWLLWLGVLFVLSVYFFPFGIVGRLARR